MEDGRSCMDTTIKQSNQPRRQRRHGARWHGADIIGGYLLAMVALFAVCAARVNLKTARWGFGLFHVGCALIALALWWQDTQRKAAARPRPPLAVEVKQPVGGVILAEPAAPVRWAEARE